MKPSKWVSPSGRVHRRRLRFFVGTAHEMAADPSYVVTLCGRREDVLWPAQKGEPVTCGICLKAQNTKAHLR